MLVCRARFDAVGVLFLAAIFVASTAFTSQIVAQQRPPGNTQNGSSASQQQKSYPQLTPAQQQAQMQAARQAYEEQVRQRQEQLKKAIQPPEGFPLQGEQAGYVDQVLDHWQKISDQVNLFRCKFQRFDYDSAQVNYRDPQTNRLAAYTVAYGEIRFAEKNKASFDTTRVFSFKAPPQKPGEQADYKEVEGHSHWGKTIHERWICNGESVFDFDFVGKRMYETRIPKDLQGNVVQSPLPFLFGANKNDIKSRYWVRYVPKYKTNEKGQKELIQDEYWLEAFPKTINDARLYSKIEIILSADNFMPIALHMYSPQYNGKDNFESRFFYFQDRKVNDQLSKLQNTFKVFVKPKLPLGWEKVDRTLASPNNSTANAAGAKGVR